MAWGPLRTPTMSTAGHAGPRRFRGFLREPEPAWGSTAVVRGVSAGEGAGRGGHTEGVERAAGAGKADDAGAASTLVFARGPPHVTMWGGLVRWVISAEAEAQQV